MLDLAAGSVTCLYFDHHAKARCLHWRGLDKCGSGKCMLYQRFVPREHGLLSLRMPERVLREIICSLLLGYWLQRWDEKLFGLIWGHYMVCGTDRFPPCALEKPISNPEYLTIHLAHARCECARFSKIHKNPYRRPRESGSILWCIRLVSGEGWSGTQNYNRD